VTSDLVPRPPLDVVVAAAVVRAATRRRDAGLDRPVLIVVDPVVLLVWHPVAFGVRRHERPSKNKDCPEVAAEVVWQK